MRAADQWSISAGHGETAALVFQGASTQSKVDTSLTGQFLVEAAD